jgi:hypothetical protein
MWECKKCHECHEDSHEVCWNCGTSKDGIEDPSFERADQGEPNLDQAGTRHAEHIASEMVYQGPAGTPQAGRAAYEFTTSQNVEFSAAGFWMRIVGIIEIVGGALACLWIFAGRIDLFIQGIVTIILGSLTLRAALAFWRVAESSGRDIENVMEAVVNLKKLYRLQVVLILIGVALVLIVISLSAVPGRR